MSNYYILKKEKLAKAKTYMPLADKIAIAKSVVENCMKDVPLAEQNHEAEKLISMPLIRVEDSGTKMVLLQNVLLGYYLDIELDPKEDIFKQYDYYAGGNLLNQIERFKSDIEIKDKVYDLLSDYKDFKKIVDAEIYNAKVNENDILGRLSASIQILSTPENIKTLSEELKKSAGEYADKVKSLKAGKKKETDEQQS